MAQFAGNARWFEPSPLFAHRARPTPLKCKNEYPVLPLGKKTAVQAVVGSIVWAFRRLKKPRCREMNARGYALYSVRPLFFFECRHVVFPIVNSGNNSSKSNSEDGHSLAWQDRLQVFFKKMFMASSGKFLKVAFIHSFRLTHCWMCRESLFAQAWYNLC